MISYVISTKQKLFLANCLEQPSTVNLTPKRGQRSLAASSKPSWENSFWRGQRQKNNFRFFLRLRSFMINFCTKKSVAVGRNNHRIGIILYCYVPACQGNVVSSENHLPSTQTNDRDNPLGYKVAYLYIES